MLPSVLLISVHLPGASLDAPALTSDIGMEVPTPNAFCDPFKLRFTHFRRFPGYRFQVRLRWLGGGLSHSSKTPSPNLRKIKELRLLLAETHTCCLP